MLEKDKELVLTDLIDATFLQELQDVFAKIIDVACIIRDDRGRITKPINFAEFCVKYVRSTESGFKKCDECGIKWGKIAAQRKESVIYTCHSGMTNFAIPIMVLNRHIGTILGGQIFTSAPDEDYFRKIARETGVNEEEYIATLREVSIIPEESIKAKADLLYIVANAISEIGYKNLKLLEKNQNENLYHDIKNAIKNSLDINQTKQRIVNIIGKFLKAERCFIVEYDPTNDRFLNVDNEYLSSPELIGYIGRDVNKNETNFVKSIKEGKPIIINNKLIYKDGIPQDYESERSVIEEYNICSCIIYPLRHSGELLGAIIIDYMDQDHSVEPEEINIVDDLADQIAIALYQVKLYNALKQTMANQNALLNNMPFMAWLKDKDSKLLSVNEAFAKMCSSTVENVNGKTDFDFFPKEHAESYIKQDKLVMDKRHMLIAEDLIAGPDGIRFHETYKSPVFDDKGNVVGTVGLARDITDRKEFEKELSLKNEKIVKAAQREKLLREIVSEISSTLDFNEIKQVLVSKLGSTLNSDLDIIYVCDPKTERFLPVDESSVHLSSDEIESPVGMNVIESYDWGDYIRNNKKPEIAYSSIEKLKNDYRLHGTKAEAFLNKYGIQSMIGMPILHANTFLGFLVMNFINEPKSITEEDINLVKIVANQAAIALYQSKLYIQAQEASRAKSEFIANMSHEIKTPLNIIIGFSEILSDSQIEPRKQIEYLKNINKSGKHLLNLTNDIISISKIESGNFKLNYENFSSEQIIWDVVESIKLIAKDKDIYIEMDTENISINADKKMLTQVLYNLIINAIKFTPEGGNIKIKSGLDNDNLIVSIIDNGIGINQIDQKIIFEKFKQVDSSVERMQQGAGLGLAITKKLIELHNGSIHLESSADKGSRFWFVLPNAHKMKNNF